MDRGKPMPMGRDMQNYYYAMQDKGSIYQGAGLPAGAMPGPPGMPGSLGGSLPGSHPGTLPGSIPGSLGGSSMQGLSSLGYGPPPPQQSSINPGVPASQTSALQQHPTASPFTSSVPGGPGGPRGPAGPGGPGSQAYPSVSYAQSPFVQSPTQAAMAMYQSPLAYSQATMAAHNSAAAYMAAAAGAQSASAAYGFPSAPGGQLYYPGQPMYASPPASMQPAMHHPHLQQGLNPSMPPAFHPGVSPFARLP